MLRTGEGLKKGLGFPENLDRLDVILTGVFTLDVRRFGAYLPPCRIIGALKSLRLVGHGKERIAARLLGRRTAR